MSSASDSQAITSTAPPALTLTLSQRERGHGGVTIEAVLRREATVSDFVAGRFETRHLGSLGLSRREGGRKRVFIEAVLRAGATVRDFVASRLETRHVGPPALTLALSQRERGQDSERLTVTYYYPWGYFYPVRSGAAAVASRQMEYLRERGHRVRMMVRAAPRRGRLAFERHYRWVDDIAVVDIGRYPDVRRCFDRWEFGGYLAGHARLAEQPEVRDWLSQPADVAFMNYVFATPLLDRVPAGAYRVLETYDIMSHQFLEHRGSPDLLEQSLADEFDLYRLYDSVLMINQEEEQFARAQRTAERRLSPRESALFGGAKDDIDDFFGRNLVYMPPSVDVAAEEDERVADYDVLFVGSDHPPNVEGVHWFYDHVYRPLLKAKGIRWAICGSVCRRLRFKDRGVIRLGPVGDLGELYRHSKIVVVPLFRGSGISIKTLEAMGHRKPVVTTPCGRRGLPSSVDDVLLTYAFDDEPAAVADAICRLCFSDALRKDYGRRAATFIADHFSTRSYARRMDGIFQPLCQRSAKRLTPPQLFS